MIKLFARTSARWEGEPFVARVVTRKDAVPTEREILITDAPTPEVSDGYIAYFHQSSCSNSADHTNRLWIPLPEPLAYLSDGDIVQVTPRTGDIGVMYRRASRSNALFVTEQCNSNCIMCSQPPKDVADRFRVTAALDAIPLMHPDTAELGITGGEPTLLGGGLLAIIASCKTHLPHTALHMLSNGRMFRYLSLCRAVADIAHPDLMIGIPLYSDLAGHHDFVVQAKGAFDQTIRGIVNLKRCNVRVELRVVLHRQTISRLPELAEFIARNLPCVDHIALMGLEMMGYVRMNIDALWVDPVHYQRELVKAAHRLAAARLNVSIYNHPLCVIDRSLWPYARKSISDWKNEYFALCRDCAVKNECGGFFSSATEKHSDFIHPITVVQAVASGSERFA